jgi:hypothetical protein
MNKNQPMRRNRYTVQPFLTVRVHVLEAAPSKRRSAPCTGPSGRPNAPPPPEAYHNFLCSHLGKVQEWLGHANVSTTRLYDQRRSRARGQPHFPRGLLSRGISFPIWGRWLGLLAGFSCSPSSAVRSSKREETGLP